METVRASSLGGCVTRQPTAQMGQTRRTTAVSSTFTLLSRVVSRLYFLSTVSFQCLSFSLCKAFTFVSKLFNFQYLGFSLSISLFRHLSNSFSFHFHSFKFSLISVIVSIYKSFTFIINVFHFHYVRHSLSCPIYLTFNI